MLTQVCATNVAVKIAIVICAIGSRLAAVITGMLTGSSFVRANGCLTTIRITYVIVIIVSTFAEFFATAMLTVVVIIGILMLQLIDFLAAGNNLLTAQALFAGFSAFLQTSRRNLSNGLRTTHMVSRILFAIIENLRYALRATFAALVVNCRFGTSCILRLICVLYPLGEDVRVLAILVHGTTVFALVPVIIIVVRPFGFIVVLCRRAVSRTALITGSQSGTGCFATGASAHIF